MTTLIELFRRFERVPDALRSTLRQTLELPALEEKGQAWSRADLGFDVTGVGASEFPARLAVQVLLNAGIRARFVPISTFLGEIEIPPGSCLVVFSQGISPNARLPLGVAARYEASFLFTGEGATLGEELARFSSGRHAVYKHPPVSESGTLLRVLGPPCAALLGLVWAARIIEARQGTAPAWVKLLPGIPECYERSAMTEESIEANLTACIAPGPIVFLAPALMWKWQEAVYAPLAPTFDFLAFAHGPFQSIASQDSLLLALETSEGDALLKNLEQVLDSDKHRVVTLRASLPAPLSIFEYDAALTSLALREMERRKIDPGNWPGKCEEKALYEIGLPE